MTADKIVLISYISHRLETPLNYEEAEIILDLINDCAKPTTDMLQPLFVAINRGNKTDAIREFRILTGEGLAVSLQMISLLLTEPMQPVIE